MNQPFNSKPSSNSVQGSQADSDGNQSFQISAPSISLPKGGGAIRGMGEKFAANPVTGTGSTTVPIATSPGRSGFGPQLSLSYDSGAGNGPFGFGWSLSLPSITRKTDKGLPKYQDAVDSDVFILSGAEDLVPVYRQDPDGSWVASHAEYHRKPGEFWVRDQKGGLVIHADERNGYRVRRYRPRIEGLFARIERWTNEQKPEETFWRSISKDNITTWYGRTENSRIFDPNDETRIFSWLICQSYDDKGNVIVYEYKAENSDGVDLAQVHERNRTDDMHDTDKANRTANHYLKRIYYGNRQPYLPKIEPGEPLPNPPGPGTSDGKPNWFFEVVFDYDDGHYTEDKPDAEGRIFAHPVYAPQNTKWKARVDPFSTYRAGFEVRTYRLCQRVLMFHHFPEELEAPDCLVRSTDFTYSYEDKPDDARNPIYSFLNSVSQSGYVRQANASYLKKSLPPLEFTYSKPEVQHDVRDVDAESLENLPYGLDGAHYQWVDLDGEGLSGILTEQVDAWYYKRNLSPLPNKSSGKEEVAAHFGPLELVAKKPSSAALSGGGQQFLDLAGDGQLDLVALSGPTPGFFERTHDEDWEAFQTFRMLPNVDWSDPHLKFVDLTGDGHADILITEDDVFWWYPSLAEDGFGPAERVAQNWDEEKGPRLVFADIENTIHLADLSGDGLSDLVRIRNAEVCYWPNLGYGRFGAKVTMDNAPCFDNPDQFDPRRIQLVDIDGSGTTDIIYLGSHGVDLYFNQSGNSWSQPHRLKSYPQTDNLSSVTAMDLLGNGTACLVWSSPLPGNARRPMRYIDLMGGQKPHLLVKTVNNLGAKTKVQYAPSTKFYVADKLAGKLWITKIPFPVHVVEKVTVTDKWRKTEFSTTYTYHHGYYDGIEREFRGFGRVEQVDVEDYGPFQIRNKNNPYVTDDDKLYQPPVKTVTWFHTGAFLDREVILSHFANEYFPAWYEALDPIKKNVLGKFQENQLPEPDLAVQGLSTEEWREALRSCKGMTLRQEIYELSVQGVEGKTHQPVKLFSTAYHNCHIQRLQPKQQNKHAVFLVTESEAITYHYELDLPAMGGDLTPDPRIAHTLNLAIDECGNILESAAVVYPRIGSHADTALTAEQLAVIDQVQKSERHLALNCTSYTHDINDMRTYRLRMPCQTQAWEVTGIKPAGQYFTLAELKSKNLSGAGLSEISYHQVPDGTQQKRLVECARTLFFADDLTTPRPFGQHGPLGLPYESYKLALTTNLINSVFVDQERNDAAVSALEQQVNHFPVSGYYKGDDLFPGHPITPEPLKNLYWIASGRAGFENDAAGHFYLPEKYTDPFGNPTTLEYDPLDLYVRSSSDALGNTASITIFDYRALAPIEMVDPNGNRTAVYFDIFGMVVASAMKGNGTEADDLTGFDDDLANPSAAAVQTFCTNTVMHEQTARDWLRNATARFVYHFGEQRDAQGRIIKWADRPAGGCGIAREKHFHAHGGANSPLQVSLECSDGSGNVLMKKAQAEPAPGQTALRWVINGLTVLNNKGKPVKQYEPGFSEIGFGCEAPPARGVTPVIYYDAAGRVVRTEMPDGTFSRVEFSPWHVKSFDANDTVIESRWYRERLTAVARGVPLHLPEESPQVKTDANDAEALAQRASAEEKRAAQLAALHANTPSEIHLDSLGREVVAIAHNRTNGVDEKYLTFTKLDAEGKPLWIRDARGNLVMQYITPPKPTRWAEDSNENIPAAAVPCYDIAGNLLYQHSMDAGDRWMINDAAGKPMFAWDQNDQGEGSALQERIFRTEYDDLHRPTAQWLKIAAADPALIEVFEYCDTNQPNGAADLDDAKARKLIGQAVKHWDPSGLSTVERIDLSGKLAHVTRTLIKPESDNDTGVLNWDVVDRNDLLESETFHQINEYDALGRMSLLYNWHRDITFDPGGAARITPGATNRVAVYEPTYNERGALFSEELHIRATKSTGQNGTVSFTADSQLSQQAIKRITYNEKGQKLSLELGNGTTTRYTYDPNTFCLIHLYTRRNGAAFTNDCTSNTADDPRPQRPCGMQNLHYTYDSVGNITHIQDDAQQTIYFSNSAVEPSNDYTYDALYRLIEATGRENAAAIAPPRNREDPWPIDGFPSATALRNYMQRYSYDAVGNFIEMAHLPGGGNGWTRHYTTRADSNRLAQTWYGGNTITAVTYRHDAHGNMLNLNRVETPPPLDPEEQWGLAIRWDWRDMIRGFDLGGGGMVRYHYGGDKQRTRKYLEREITDSDSTKRWVRHSDRIYLGGYELYRRYNGNGTTVVEEIESHHFFEGEQRVLLVDDVLKTDRQHANGALFKTEPVFRYQYSNHLRSACLELDPLAEIISYEEYHPYGTSAYRAMKKGIEASPKRYRYTTKERDEESGLYYHGARYYASCLGKWSSCDPTGLTDGPNLYEFCRCNAINFADQTGCQAGSDDAPKRDDYHLPPSGINLEPHLVDRPKSWLTGALTSETPQSGANRMDNFSGLLLGDQLATKFEGGYQGGTSFLGTSESRIPDALLKELPSFFSQFSSHSKQELTFGTSTRWGEEFSGVRLDSTTILRFDFKAFGAPSQLQVGWRTTISSSAKSDLAQQRVGEITLKIGPFEVSASNDLFGPGFIGGGTDQANTAAARASVRLGVPVFGLQLERMSLDLRLGTGIPPRIPTRDPIVRLLAPDAGDPDWRKVDDEGYYRDVKYPNAFEGSLAVSAAFSDPKGRFGLDISLGWNSAAIKHFFQGQLIHKPLGIPLFREPKISMPYIQVGITVPFK